ncbi:hypothetical protein [Martelella sp. HB161492]|uniref:hypothetical protein n=1 Tax=Martelella sp. HB161492 TaxID=2720726 RepID=UPI00159007D2|nr:hypothetical protein [Martelella sp. HB161492]
MKKLMLIAILLGGLAPVQSSLAADCSKAASAVVSSTGGQLLSAVPAEDGSKCVVTVIVNSNDGSPPRKISRTVPANGAG